MADEQQSPSSEPTSSDAQGSAPVSEEASEESRVPSWWDRLMGRGPRREATDETTGEPAEAASGPAASDKLVLTQEELDRRVQSETDRREAKRLEAARAAERRRLRDEDPFAYAEADRKAEQISDADTSLVQLFGTIGAEHDKATIDPVVQLLPQPERDRILRLDGAGRGLDGRRLIMAEAMKALEKHWRAEGAKDAEAHLRKNPAFRKQVLSEVRGSTPEPELLPSGSVVNHGRSSDEINDMLRQQIGIHREA